MKKMINIVVITDRSGSLDKKNIESLKGILSECVFDTISRAKAVKDFDYHFAHIGFGNDAKLYTSSTNVTEEECLGAMPYSRKEMSNLSPALKVCSKVLNNWKTSESSFVFLFTDGEITDSSKSNVRLTDRKGLYNGHLYVSLLGDKLFISDLKMLDISTEQIYFCTEEESVCKLAEDFYNDLVLTNK